MHRAVRRAATATACVLLLVGCTSSHHDSGPHRLVLDDGALVITPVPGAAPRISQAFAARVLASQELDVMERSLPAVAASVRDIPARINPDSGSFHSQPLALPLAWVYVGYQGRGLMSCSGPGPMTEPTPSMPTQHPSYAWVVIVDATTGSSYVYTGVQAGMCIRGAQPRVRAASLTYSMPFTLAKLAPELFRWSVRVPPCGRVTSLGPGRVGMASVTVPTAACHGKASTFVLTEHGHVGIYPHAPLGEVCWYVYDALLGPPRDCVEPDGRRSGAWSR